MTGQAVISNSSPLIALTQIQKLDLLRELFRVVLVPPAVARETARSVRLPEWIHIRPPVRAIDHRITRAGLGPGESER